MSGRGQRISVLAALLASFARAQTGPAPVAPGHSESQFAHELLHLKQVDLIDGQLAAAKGTAAENLWKAQRMVARWDELTKDAADTAGLTQAYLAALGGYVKNPDASDSGGIDGVWAMDQAQFILLRLAQPMLTRMEYFADNARDRRLLVPLAEAGDGMIQLAAASLEKEMKRIEGIKPFDEKGYQRAYVAAGEVRYYLAWDRYVQAMAAEPGTPERKAALGQCIQALTEWAVDAPDNGVNFQAYLLRGKAESQAGETEQALADLAKARAPKAPAWVQYQGGYQTVVAYLRAKDFLHAQSALGAFKSAIPSGNSETANSADMLGYRVARAMAEANLDASERRKAIRDALAMLTQVMARYARFRDLVYEQLAAAVPDNADLNGLFPMEQLAVAWATARGQQGQTAESKAELEKALRAAEAVKINPTANNPDKLEATFLQGLFEAQLGKLMEAAGYEVAFATQAPQDPRARMEIDVALDQIGQLRRAAGAQPGGADAEALRKLADEALKISIETFGDTKWLFARGRLLEDEAQPGAAALVYEKIGVDDRNYLDARYRLVVLATQHFGDIEGKAPAREQQEAAKALFDACGKFTDLLDHPPASAPAETLQAAQGYRYNIWLIEAGTALAPAVHDSKVALERLAQLEGARDKLNDAQRNLAMGYQVQAYQLAGETEKARTTLAQYAKTGPEALGHMRNMAAAAQDQMGKTNDPAEIRQLANLVTMLLDPLIDGADAGGKADDAFEYRLIQADMLTRAGRFEEAEALAVKLQTQRKEDTETYLAEARAMFGQAEAGRDGAMYAKAQDYFTRILPRLNQGSEPFWEAWLRIMEAMDAQGGSAAEIKSRLGDLKTVYGTKFGGVKWRGEWEKLAGKYGV